MTDDERKLIEHKAKLLKCLLYPNLKRLSKDQDPPLLVSMSLGYPDSGRTGLPTNAEFKLEFSDGTVLGGRLEDLQIYNPRTS